MSEGITLVIGGMGIKGAANIGALQVLRDHEVKVNRIVATGIGALVGAQFAMERDLDVLIGHMVNFFKTNRGHLWGMERLTGSPSSQNRRILDSFSYFIRASRFCRTNAKGLSIFPWAAVDGDLQELFGDVVPSQLKVPLSISAIDLTRGEEVLLEEEALVDRLKAGISFPGIVPPMRMGDGEFVTSSLYCELPLGKLEKTDSPIVAIDIPRNPPAQRPDSVLETLAQLDELLSADITRKLLAKADQVYTLAQLDKLLSADIKRKLLAKANQVYTLAQLDELLGADITRKLLAKVDQVYTPQRPASALDTIAQMDELRSATIKRKLLAKADQVYTLNSLKEFRWDNYDKIPSMVNQARREMEQLLTRKGGESR